MSEASIVLRRQLEDAIADYCRSLVDLKSSNEYDELVDDAIDAIDQLARKRLSAELNAVEWVPREIIFVESKGKVGVGEYPFDFSPGEALNAYLKIGDEIFAIRGVEWDLGHSPRRGDEVSIVLGHRRL